MFGTNLFGVYATLTKHEIFSKLALLRNVHTAQKHLLRFL
jgi:hypothetical protein